MNGIVASLAASVLFGLLYFYVALLSPLSGDEVFGWRIVLIAPYLAVFLRLTGGGPAMRALADDLRRRPARLWGLLLSAALLGVQLWLFTWAPLHGHALDVSLGYFLMPLCMVWVGRALYGDRLSTLQYAAAAVAALGVAHEVYRTGGFAWPALVVALGYPLYFVWRRRIGMNHTLGFFVDVVLLLPVALWLLGSTPTGWSYPLMGVEQAVLLVGLGLLTMVSLTCYMMASRLLSLSLFGLLGYVEPALLVVAAIALGERLSGTDFLTYVPIWLAVGLLALDGLLALRRSQGQAARRSRAAE